MHASVKHIHTKKGIDEKSGLIQGLKQEVKVKSSNCILFWLYPQRQVHKMKVERTKDD